MDRKLSVVPVTVVIPTLGRLEQLESCLRSVRECDPPAAELLVVDQSGREDVLRLVKDVGGNETRLVRCPAHGVGNARNLGLREARHDLVLVTDDDCTVATDWAEQANALVARHRGYLITGRVLPSGDPRAVPSTIDRPEPYDHTGGVDPGALYPNNMVLQRSMALELGGFDDRVLYAEDNDFCYRWLRAGWGLRYEPSMLVWHHDWRSHEALSRLYVRYYQGQGRFYSKHLRRRDLTMLRFVGRDLFSGVRSLVSWIVKRRPRWTDPRRGILPGLIPGMVEGWRTFAPTRQSDQPDRRP
jgi:GT2 family glycosyltransferase